MLVNIIVMGKISFDFLKIYTCFYLFHLKPIPDGEKSEDLPKSSEKFERTKKQKGSSSRHSKYATDRKKLKLSKDEAAESESSNFTSVDEVCF